MAKETFFHTIIASCTLMDFHKIFFSLTLVMPCEGRKFFFLHIYIRASVLVRDQTGLIFPKIGHSRSRVFQKKAIIGAINQRNETRLRIATFKKEIG